MLKNLLTIAFLACSASGYAQVLLPKYETPIFDSSNVAEETVEALDASDFTYGMKAPKTSYAYGFYYERPKGVMYRTFNDLGSGMGPMYLCTPAFKEIRITPHVYNEAAPVTWEYRYITKDSTRVVDVTDNVDPNTGEFVVDATAPGYYTAAPTMIQDDSTFVLGSASKYWTAEKYTNFTRVTPMTDFLPMSFFDDHTNVKNIVGWGSSMSSHYLFGSGVYKDTCNAYATYQIFEEPISPVYVDYVFMKYVSFSENPIPEGQNLTMYVYNPDTKERYAVLTAGHSDFVQNKASSGTYGTYYTGVIYFYNKVEDDFGAEGTEPFVIDGYFGVQINGLGDDGIDIGFNGVLNPDEDQLTAARQMVICPDGSTKSFTYKTPYSLGVYFQGFLDAIKVEAEENKITVANDGAVVDSATVYTAYPWFGYDEDGSTVLTESADEYYYFDEEELPEWVINYSANAEGWKASTSAKRGITKIAFECEPLPEGVEGRQAKLYLKGRGVTADVPIVLTQGTVVDVVLGDADEDGVVTVSDITTIAAFILGNNPSPFNKDNADVDGDGEITVSDITGTAGIILGK